MLTSGEGAQFHGQSTFIEVSIFGGFVAEHSPHRHG